MKPIKFNADYEYELFFKQKAPKALNEAIEFFHFFRSTAPLHTQKKYSQDYLDYLKTKFGLNPQLISEGDFENFWGKNKNLKLERELNSKITSARFQDDTLICYQLDDLKPLPLDGSFIVKDPYGMSGQNVFRLYDLEAVKRFPVLAEPFKNRIYDFSLFRFSDGKIIYYENIVNEKFQYKGTIISADCSFKDLSFYSKLESTELKKHEQKMNEVIEYYSSFEEGACFSIDSFVYELNGEFKIQSVCEVNYRRTMGSIAYELINKYSPDKKGRMLLLKKGGVPLYKKYGDRTDLMVLSPGDTRFEIVLVLTDENVVLDID